MLIRDPFASFTAQTAAAFYNEGCEPPVEPGDPPPTFPTYPVLVA